MQRRARALPAADPERKPAFVLRGFAFALAALAGAGVGQAEEEAPLQPYQMVRSLQLVQDRIADGDHAALPMQKKLLELIDARLRKAGAEDFEDKRNYRSALIYSMSGGNPVTLEVVRSRLKLEPADAALVDAVLAYLNGRPQEARQVFRTVDPMAQTADLGAFLALVKGSLLANEDPAAAIALFDKARLLGPGTLVEEAALRRSLGLAGRAGDAKRFAAWSSQYVRRFLRSPYASQFADAFVSGVVALHASIDFPAIEEVIEGMQPEQRKVIYLRLARRAAIEGLADVAVFAARHVEAAPQQVAGDDPRAVLYASLSDVRSGNIDVVLTKLKGIDRARLSERDRQLLDAVQSIASQVTAPVDEPASEPAESPDVENAAGPAGEEAGEIARAEEAARAEGPLPEMVPEAEPEEAAKADPAPAAPGHAEAATPSAAGEPPADHGDEPAEEPAAGANHEPAGHAAAGDAASEPPVDEATAAAALMATDARQKLEAIDKLLEENAKK
jgi:chemotaxis protein MotC